MYDVQKAYGVRARPLAAAAVDHQNQPGGGLAGRPAGRQIDRLAGWQAGLGTTMYYRHDASLLKSGGRCPRGSVVGPAEFSANRQVFCGQGRAVQDVRQGCKQPGSTRL
jgi:hypothetical protein